jgi:protein TonB
MERRAGLMHAQSIRFSVALLIAFVLWAVLLTQFLNPLLQPLPSPAAPVLTTVEMRLVEMAEPSANMLAVPSARPTSVTPQVHARRREPSPTRVAKPHEIQHPATDNVMAKIKQPATPAQPETSPSASTNASVSTSSSPAPSRNTAEPSTGSAARAITQPMPSLPDDLREDAFQAIAVARFDIHADGTIEVELSKPTQNPRLNSLLLESLHKWRFFPAMQGGHPVESHQDVRVHFNVS